MHRFGPGRSDWLLHVNITSFWFIFDYIFWRKVQLYEHYQWRIVSLDILWCIKCLRCYVLWIISQHLHVVSNNALSIISNKNSGPFKVHLSSLLKVLLMRLLNVTRSRGRHVGVEEGRTRSISLWVKPWIKRRSLEIYDLNLACLCSGDKSPNNARAFQIRSVHRRCGGHVSRASVWSRADILAAASSGAGSHHQEEQVQEQQQKRVCTAFPHQWVHWEHVCAFDKGIACTDLHWTDFRKRSMVLPYSFCHTFMVKSCYFFYKVTPWNSFWLGFLQLL